MEQPQSFAARDTHSPAHSSQTPSHLLPLAALMLASSMGAAQPAFAQSEEKTLKTVTVKDTQDPNLSRESLLVKQTGIAKGKQQLKDIPQTVTVMTEKLMADRNYDDFREVLKSTAGVTFQAGETGEEDVRMRGFSLGQAGDIYVDGLRDAPLIERDTFNTDRVEVLKGSASMLFGKGSTGGVVNQVNKQPFLMDQNETNVTIGSGQMKRVTADMNKQTGESSAFRVNAMTHDADNWGAKVGKKGIAGAYRTGIGERDEYTVGLYHLETDGRPLYNHPWLIDNGRTINGGGGMGSGANTSGTIVPVLDARNYYGLESDYLRTKTTYATLGHQHRFDQDRELKTTVRVGRYSRDLLASAIGFRDLTTLSVTDSTRLTRTPKGRRGESDVIQAQSDYTGKFNWLGLKHSLIAGVDFSQEEAKRNNSATDPLTSTYTTVGNPDSGTTVIDTRVIGMNTFKSQNLGIYAQDTLAINETVKLIGGMRVENFSATYRDVNGYSVSLNKTLPSPRLGALWQPTEYASYYTSFGTSYNTSGDSYQYGLGTALSPTVLDRRSNTYVANTSLTTLNTPPEKSRNFEIGGKYDLFQKQALLGVALFHSEKYNERNTDVDSATNQYLLSGKRHATGMEFNFAGRITPAWEVFYNHTWIPGAKIDVSSVSATTCNTANPPVCTPNNAQQKGDRPALTPKHSASLWSTYRINTAWRVGGGLNYRGEQNPDGARLVVAPAFTTVDAMAEYAINDANLLKLNVSNLTNKLYADTLYRGFYGPGAPRRVELSWKSMF